MLPKLRSCATTFDAISVREDTGVDIFRNDLNRDDAVHVLDPTMLLDPTYYETLCEGVNGGVPDGKDGFMYCLDMIPYMMCILKGIPNMHLMNKTSKDVGHFLQGFSKCKYVVTDSFHGCVFSLIFNKPFVCIGNNMRGNARFDSLLKLFKCQNRFIDQSKPLDLGLIKKLLSTPLGEEIA